MTDFVGDNDHGDTLPPSEVLFKEVLELRKQRDEARRMVCRALYTDKEMQRNHARLCGWDCFRDYDKANEALDRLAELDQELGLQ
jgi:hypothetical protein